MLKNPLVVALALAAVAVVGGLQYANASPSSPEELMGKAAPDFQAARIGGGAVSLQQLRGKVVVLDFWYRGCGWCLRAMPQINALATQYCRQGVVVLGMNVDPNEADARAVMAQLGLRYDCVRTPRETVKAFGVEGYPTAIVIDQAGVVRAVHVGYTDDLGSQIEGTIKGLLRK